MRELMPFVRQRGGTAIELGSRDGHNAKEISDMFASERTITIEANPECWKDICNSYPHFENHNVAISNRSGLMDFYAVKHDLDPILLGQSSLLYKSSYETIADKIKVEALTMDDFVEKHNISEIEVMKIDVEGSTLEVFQGFSKVRMTRLLHVESEHKTFWDGQSLYEDTAKFLTESGYEQVFFAPVWTEQSDSIWLRKE